MRATSLPQAIGFVLAAVSLSGCIERKLLLRSEPTGAEVFIDGFAVGATPLDLSFTYYGGRRITMRHEDYQVRSELLELNAPWYEVFPLDLVTEAFVPFRIVDAREVHFRLDPRPPSGPLGGQPGASLIRRADEELRRRGLR